MVKTRVNKVNRVNSVNTVVVAKPTNKITPQDLVNKALNKDFHITVDELCDIIAIFSFNEAFGGTVINWEESSVYIPALNLMFSWLELNKVNTGRNVTR